MALKTLVAVAVTAAFAVSPLTQAQSDKASSGASAGATAPFSSLDKDKDGSISRDEAKGTPLETDFSMLDKDGDGKLSPSEHAAAPAAGGKAGAGATKPEAPAPKKQ
jgi:Ca2+-binding EF-hand superfamily protein